MGLRCVIVDDNPGFLDAASRELSDGGFTVVGTAGTSAEASARARETKPDVVLVDIMLGPESGLDLARQLAQETHAGPTRVILISTHAADDFTDLIEASPVIGFLPKSRISAGAVEQLLAKGDSEKL